MPALASNLETSGRYNIDKLFLV